MSSSTKTLVFLWLCLYQVSGFPAAKRPSAPGDDDDVISGSDFLTVFMSQRSDPSATASPVVALTDRSSSTRDKSYYSRQEDNSVVLKFPILSQYSEDYEKYNRPYDTDIDFREPNMSPEVRSEVNVPDVDVKGTQTSTNTTEESPTTLEAESLTAEQNIDKSQSGPVKNDLQPTSTAESMKVISVRVSSSVARHSGKAIASHSESKQTQSNKATSETNDENARVEEVVSQTKENQEGLQAEESQQSKASETNPFVLTEENLVSTLVTQDEPTITAARRDQFGVEEASAREDHTYLDVKPKELINVYEYAQQKSIPGIVREVKRIQTEEIQSENQKPLQIGNYHNPPEALTSAQSEPVYSQIKLHENLSTENKEPQPTSAGFYQESDNMNSPASPVSYRTNVATGTSESRVQFYRDHPTYNRESVAETVQRNVVAKQEQVVTTQGNDSSNTAGDHRDARYQEKPHYEQTEKNYELPEQVYGRPEQNYEVDEGVSVVTNGRAHGLQIPTPQPDRKDQKDANHKFGYVVEGRNYRKYRVEERTPDGFIVGEYGVVSHDDGSLRGVRYTADSTINPRLIYDALVKFLSLK